MKQFKLPFRHGTRRITSLALAVMMIVGIFTALPFTASAVEEETTVATEATATVATEETQPTTADSKPASKNKGKISTGASTKSQTTGEVTASGTCGNDLTWELEDGTLTISGTGAMNNYTNNKSNLPPWYSAYRNSIKTVVIEDGVTSIGNYAFLHCNAIEKLTISDSVVSIGFYACQDLYKLSTVTITDDSQLSAIYNFAFDNCNNLKRKPNIPDGCYVYANAFKNCGFAEGICNENISWLLEEGTLTISGSGSMPNYNNPHKAGLSNYAPWSGNKTSITNVIIEDGITSIGKYAFSYCTNLISVTIPDSVCNIGEGGFYYCPNLANIEIPNSVTSIGDQAFFNCDLLINLRFPSDCTVSSTAISGFFGSGEPSELTLLSWNYDYLNNTLEINGENNMMNFNFYHRNPLRPSWETINESITVKINEGVKSIGNYAFDGCNNIKSVIIENGVTSIGNHAFCGCTGITNVNIPNSVISINGNAFGNCTSLISLIIPDSVTRIGPEAFAGCTNLSSVIVGNDTNSIGYCAFFGCSNANIVVSDSVKSIDRYAFYDCNMVICPMDSYTYDLLTGDNFTRYRTSNTMVVGIVTAKSQLSYILKKKNSSANLSSAGKAKPKISTGALAKHSTGDDDDEGINIEEEVLTPEQIAENLSHVQCYVVEELEIDETLTFDSDLDVTLHLNDYETDSKGNVKVDKNGNIVDGEPHTLTASSTDALIEVPGKLTIEATSESEGGIINTKGKVFDVKEGGSLKIENGTYSEDVSEYIDDDKVISKNNNRYTVVNPATEDLELETDGREVIMPNNQDLFARNELVGVQMRSAEEREYLNEGDGQTHTVAIGEGMRFVSVVRSDILRGAEDYGYVLVRATSKDFIDNNKDKIVANGSGCKTVSLKGTKNTLANTAYSSANLDEGKYKYLTTAVSGINDDNHAVGARFYIKRADGTYVYSDYTCISTMGMLKAA